MSRVITIGTNVSRGGLPAVLDVDVLLRTRLLIQAASGGGKSWLLRVLVEQLRKLGVMVLVLDPEGEFPSLREKFDFVVAGVGGDTSCDPATAAVLARRLLKHRASAVLDLFDLPPSARREFVKAFLNAMVDAPKALWTECVIVLDEAHLFAPEKGHGESASSESVMSMATRGRKRGFCLVPATQRLSKLHKDVAAECGNNLIGMTTLDVDRERAADALGVAREDRRRFMAEVKMLPPGSFHALGRALTTETTLVRIGAVETSHPEPGSNYVVPDRPHDSLAEVVASLADLPRQAVMEATEVETLRDRVQVLERELAARPEARPEIPPEVLAAVRNAQYEIASTITTIENTALEQKTRLGKVIKSLDENVEQTEAGLGTVVQRGSKEHDLAVQQEASRQFERANQASVSKAPRPNGTSTKASGDLSSGQLRLLATIAVLQRTGPVTRGKAAICACMSSTGGTAKTYFGMLVGRGLVEAGPDGLRATSAGLALLESLNNGLQADVRRAIAPRLLVSAWKEKLDGKRKELLEFGALEAPPNHPLKRAELAAGAKMDVKGGTFKTYFGHMVGLGLFVRTSHGYHVHPSLAIT